jgi:hypothetical protein
MLAWNRRTCSLVSMVSSDSNSVDSQLATFEKRGRIIVV